MFARQQYPCTDKRPQLSRIKFHSNREHFGQCGPVIGLPCTSLPGDLTLPNASAIHKMLTGFIEEDPSFPTQGVLFHGR